jgi:hypothetical protein
MRAAVGKTQIPDEFSITEKMRRWASTKIPHFNIDSEHENFCDYWKAHGKKMADWEATWRVWMRRAPEFAGRHRNSRSVAAVEMPYERGERTPGPPIHIRDHPLFRGLKAK